MRPWYRIQAASESEAEVYIYDEIGGWGLSVEQFAKDFAALKAPKIHVRINSPGGSVFDGMAMYQAIKRHPSDTVAHIDGIAASIASVVALAADRVEMAQGARYMIHEPWAIAVGTAEELRKTADLAESASDDLVAIYADAADQTKRQIRAWMADETWFTAKEAKEAGFIDAITDGDVVKASIRPEVMAKFRHLPEDVRALTEEVKETPRTIRAVERRLREAGFSAREAKRVAPATHRALKGSRDESGEAEWEAAAEALAASLKS